MTLCATILQAAATGTTQGRVGKEEALVDRFDQASADVFAVGFIGPCARTSSDNDRPIPDELAFQGQMILDPDYAGHVLRKDFERFALSRLADGAPQIYHTAVHHDIEGSS